MRASMVRVALSAVIITGIAYSQAGPAFEVSPAASAGRASLSRTPQRIAFQSALVPDIIAFAYGLPLDRIERRPQFMYDNRYDVAVTTTATATLAEQKVLLQNLLEQRFGLVVHRISYPSTVYYLVAGPKVNLTRSAEQDDAEPTELLGASLRPSGLVRTATHVSMSDLAASLYTNLQLPVLDKTGITGYFDIQITGTPLRGGAEGTIKAVQNSLGLDLEVHRGTAESLIIDRAEEPRRN
jgi:uncharacterized protein (TIGR03435 family)